MVDSPRDDVSYANATFHNLSGARQVNNSLMIFHVNNHDKLGASTICEAMIRLDLTPGTYISPHGKESLAPQCLDTVLRSEWRDWLVQRGLWMSRHCKHSLLSNYQTGLIVHPQ